MAKMYPNVPLF